MDKLLSWSIAQQSGDKEAIAKVGAPDPKMLEQLFGGPDEPALMKQAILVAKNPEATEENRVIALENFEMLIENLDNANNIQNIKLWPDIISFLSAEETDIQVLAALIVGIAVQNNPDAQKAYLSHNGLQTLVEIATKKDSISKELYYKVLFALLSLIRNDKEAYDEFEKQNGWNLIKFEDADNSKTRLRTLSLLSAALLTGLKGKEHYIHKSIILQLLNLLEIENHPNCIDKVLNIITHLYMQGYKFEKLELQLLEKGLALAEKREDVSQDDVSAAKSILSK